MNHCFAKNNFGRCYYFISPSNKSAVVVLFTVTSTAFIIQGARLPALPACFHAIFHLTTWRPKDMVHKEIVFLQRMWVDMKNTTLFVRDLVVMWEVVTFSITQYMASMCWFYPTFQRKNQAGGSLHWFLALCNISSINSDKFMATFYHHILLCQSP